MHGAPAAARAAVRFAIHLRHDLAGGDSPNERMAMLAIGGNDIVVVANRGASRLPQPPPRRCRDARTLGSSPSNRARRSSPRAAGCEASATGDRGHGRVRYRDSTASSFQCRRIPFGQAELARLQQASHDLSATRLGKALREVDSRVAPRSPKFFRPKPRRSFWSSSLHS